MSTMQSKFSAKSKQASRNKRSLNALKHGAYSVMMILPGEDPKEFLALHTSLIAEWNPEGLIEEDAVLDMAKGIWRKARGQRFLGAKMEGCRHDPEHALFDEGQALLHCYRNLEKLGPEHVVGPEHVDLCLATISKHDAQHLRQKFSEEDFKSKSQWIDAIRKEIITVVLPTCLRVRLGTPPSEVLLDASAKVISPEVCDYELAVEERCNALIDRALKRLIQSKAMKQIFPSLPEPRKQGHLIQEKRNEL